MKIRGFRIQLGEIDDYLSAHDMVIDNITLVRRNRDEEKFLVSYIVPDMQKWPQWLERTGRAPDEGFSDESLVGRLRLFWPLGDDIRQYLRTKLPSYAVPEFIIPLERFPLNPNGKKDKPALPFPDAAEFAAARPVMSADVTLTPTEQRLACIWAQLIPSIDERTLSPEENFFEIGGHSLSAQHMLIMVNMEWVGADVPMSAMLQSPTLGEIDRRMQYGHSYSETRRWG